MRTCLWCLLAFALAEFLRVLVIVGVVGYFLTILESESMNYEVEDDEHIDNNLMLIFVL